MSIAIVACDAPITPAVDAGADAARDAATIPIAEPTRPTPPVLTPCPAGWREVTDETGVVTCDPWPVSGYRADCAPDEAHFVGTPGCARVGSACPLDGWPEDLPADRPILYVDDDARSGGDGTSRATALASIGAATAVAPSGAVIAVAVGRYDEIVRVGAGVMLWGACVSGTQIVTTTPTEEEAALNFVGDGASARNLGVDAPERPGILADGFTGITVDSVVVTRARLGGLWLYASEIAASDLVVRGMRPGADGGTGRGVQLQQGAHLVLRRAVIDDSRDVGMLATAVGTTLEASDVLVRGTSELEPPGRAGRGAYVQTGARLVLARAVFEDNHESGIYVNGDEAASVEATDLVVRRTLPRLDGERGRGITLVSGAHATLSRALVEDNVEIGVFIGSDGSAVDVSDTVVRGTRERTTDSTAGRGFEIASGAHVTLSRVIVDDNRDDGIFVSQAGTDLNASDIVVRRTREIAIEGTRGRGVYVENGPHVVLTRTLVEDNRDIGIYVSGAGTTAEVADLTVRDTLPRMLGASFGMGVWVQDEAALSLDRARIERSHWVGLGAATRAAIEARDVVVSGVVASPCPPLSCAGESGGYGIVATFGGTLRLTRFSIEDATRCGVLVGAPALASEPSGVDLDVGVITRAAIGACVQADGFDPSRILAGVEYRDVGVPLRATSYALPEVADGS